MLDNNVYKDRKKYFVSVNGWIQKLDLTEKKHKFLKSVSEIQKTRELFKKMC